MSVPANRPTEGVLRADEAGRVLWRGVEVSESLENDATVAGDLRDMIADVERRRDCWERRRRAAGRLMHSRSWL